MDSNHQLNALLSHIGKKLADIRHTRNEKLSNAAKAINVSTGTMSQIENGRYDHLSMKLVIKLANYYDVAISELFTDAANGAGM